jgi:eukaryotic-like serine/threonine-protein kinase
MGTPTQVSGDVVANRYRVLRPIATGGYGTVYEALSLQDGSRLALKILHSRLGSSPAEIERFRREAALVRALEHPHIVRVLDFGQTDDATPYIAFELLRGQALRQELGKRGRLGWEEVAAIAAQVLDALRLAHERGVVHRDIKPSNLYLCRAGATPSFVKVLDFGIAKALRGDISARTQLTETGQLLGTPHYMAPEQVRGDAISAAVDLYSLGLIMAEMLSGARLVSGKNDLEVLLAHIAGPEHVLPGEVRDSPLSAVVEGAVRKRLDARYQSAAEMLADVQQAWQAGTGVPMQDESAVAPTVATGPSVAALRRSVALGPPRDAGATPAAGAPVRARRWLWPVALGVAALLICAGAVLGYLVLGG